jgi:hypothetical protein
MKTMFERKSRSIAYLLFLVVLLFSLAAISPAQSDSQNPNRDGYATQSQPPQGRSSQVPEQMSGEIGQGAQAEAPDDQADPPSRVARISFLDGSVSMQPGGTGDWGAASLNRPVTIGDKLWTDQNSRLELEAGEASIHLGSMTALSFLNLNDNATQMRLAEGRINFRVREMREGDLYEVDTPNLAFTVRQAGAFRIDVNENGDTTNVTVIRGEGEVAAGGQAYTVHAGERATITGTDNNVQYDVKAAPLTPDELDRWAEQRDLREENSASAKHVNRDVVGYSDLDDYGTWNEEPTYGSVWYPNSVPVGWAPYSNGYWNWVGPWGWTWVDHSPWGFAPYHYGRWIYGGGRWGWCPGPIYARPYYGPAYVGFLGGFHGGFGFGVGFGVGVGVGWFPLGWGEAYHPWYHAGPGYWNNINVHNTYIRNVNVIHNGTTNYAFAHNVNAVTVASHSAFTSGQAINRSAAHVTEASLRGATVTNYINATPTHASYFAASNAHARVSTPSSAIQNRSVVARTAPAAAASHLPARRMNTAALRPNTTASNGARGLSSSTYNRTAATNGKSATMNRQQEIASSRPPSARPQGSFNTYNTNTRSNPTSIRSWNAQGNVTDSGRAPQGFGANRPTTGGNVRPTQMNQTNRPLYAGSYGNANSRATVNRPPSNYRPPTTYRAPTNYNGNRSYSPPRANTSMPSRTYSPPAPRASYGSGSHPSGGGGYSRPSGGGGGSHPSGGGGHPSGGGGHPHR